MKNHKIGFTYRAADKSLMDFHFTDKTLLTQNNDIFNLISKLDGVACLWDFRGDYYIRIKKGHLFSFEEDIIPEIVNIYQNALIKAAIPTFEIV